MEIQVLAYEHIFAPGSCAFAQCHASTLCALPDGSLAAAWFAGSEEKAPDTAIWFARRTADGWRPPQKAADAPGVACWNPVLFFYSGQLWLFYKVGAEIPDWRTFWQRSADGGAHWTAAAELVAGDTGGRGPVKNKPLLLRDGAILAPASTEKDGWRCFTDRSDDGGASWQRSPDVPLDCEGLRGAGVIQPTLWQSDDGSVHMLMRSGEGVLFASHSTDGGRSWAPAQKTALANNNSGVDLARLADGRLVLAGNPVADNWGARSAMALRLSADDGRSWSEPQLLEYLRCDVNAPWAEFSYPAVIACGDEVLVSYTWKRRTIAVWRLRV